MSWVQVLHRVPYEYWHTYIDKLRCVCYNDNMRNKYTRDFLAPVIADATSWIEVCRRVGVTPMTGAQTHIKKRAIDFGIDFSHFPGQAWSRGRTFTKKNVTAYLIEHSPIKSATLRQRLIRDGLKEEKCERCGLEEWQGEAAPLEVDHINHVHDDCRIENLQILCANCHTLKTNRDRHKLL